MFKAWRRAPAALGGWLCGLALAAAACAAAASDAAANTALSADASAAARWVFDSADHRGRPYAIVDKKAARIHVFEPPGVLVGASPVLLGLARGDRDAVATLGEREPGSLAPAERTTPAGRFDSEPGHNDKGEAIVWIDYDAALAIHRLRPAPAHQQRPQRLVSADPDERRISFGCVVVPVAFYEQVVAPTLGRRRGVVYVLPEEAPVGAMLRPPTLTPPAL